MPKFRVGSTNHLNQWIPVTLASVIKPPKRQADPLPPCEADVKNDQSCIFTLLHMPSWLGRGTTLPCLHVTDSMKKLVECVIVCVRACATRELVVCVMDNNLYTFVESEVSLSHLLVPVRSHINPIYILTLCSVTMHCSTVSHLRLGLPVGLIA